MCYFKHRAVCTVLQVENNLITIHYWLFSKTDFNIAQCIIRCILI